MMGQRQTSYARQARRDLADARRATREVEQAERKRLEERAKAAQPARERAAAAAKRARREAFDALQPGDSLERFGLAATVRRTNRKSVTTTLGTRWTLAELGAE